MILKVDEFKKVLDYAKMCLPSTSLIPALTHICFRKDSIITFNGIESVVINYTTGLNCAMPGKVFCNFIDSINGVAEIDIKQAEEKVKVKIGKSVSTFNILSEDNYPYKHDLTDTIPITAVVATDDDFVNGVKKCLVTAGNNEMIINQYGISFYNDCLYSSDGKRLSKYTLQQKYGLIETFKVLIPRGFCEDFTKIAPSPECKLYFSARNMWLTFKVFLNETTSVDSVLCTQLFVDVSFLNFDAHTNISIEDTDYYLSSTFEESIEKCKIFLKDATNNTIELDITESVEIKALGKFGVYNNTLDIISKRAIGKFKMEIDLFNQLINSVTFVSFIKCIDTVISVGKEGNYLHLLGSCYTRG